MGALQTLDLASTDAADLRRVALSVNPSTGREVVGELAAPTAYTWTGPALGQVGAPLTLNLSVLGPMSAVSPCTFTFSDGSGGGTFNPISVVYGGDAYNPATTITYTPAGTAGPRSLAVSSGGKLTDPPPIALTVTTGAANGSLPFASPAPFIDIDPNNDPTVTQSGGYVTALAGGNNTTPGATSVQTSASPAVMTLDTVTLPGSLGTKKALTIHPSTEALDLSAALSQLRTQLANSSGVVTIVIVAQLDAAGGQGLFDFGQSSSTSGFINHCRMNTNQATSSLRTITSDGSNGGATAYGAGGSAALNVPVMFAGTFKNNAQPEAQYNHTGITTGTGTIPSFTSAVLANFDNCSIGNYKLNNAYQTNIGNQFKLLRLLAFAGDQLNDQTIADWATATYGTP